MDRNTTIGLVFLGLILTVFSVINQPSKSDLKKKKSAKTELKENKESKKDETRFNSNFYGLNWGARTDEIVKDY